jgi:hypothetical protein
MLKRVGALLAVLVVATAAVAWLAGAMPAAGMPEGDAVASVPASGASDGARPLAASRWTFVGCFKLRPWTQCLDVFRDPDGALWLCGECGKTKNPAPGKCRRVSESDLQSGTWCSATERE